MPYAHSHLFGIVIIDPETTQVGSEAGRLCEGRTHFTVWSTPELVGEADTVDGRLARAHTNGREQSRIDDISCHSHQQGDQDYDQPDHKRRKYVHVAQR